MLHVKRIRDVFISDYKDAYIITNHDDASSRKGIQPDDIVCFSENNAHALCDLINETNSFNPEYDSTKELKEVMDCIRKYGSKLDSDVVCTLIEEIYNKRESN